MKRGIERGTIDRFEMRQNACATKCELCDGRAISIADGRSMGRSMSKMNECMTKWMNE